MKNPKRIKFINGTTYDITNVYLVDGVSFGEEEFVYVLESHTKKKEIAEPQLQDFISKGWASLIY